MNNRITLASLAILFFGPVIAAYVWFYHFNDHDFSQVNKGVLVEPPQSLLDLSVMVEGTVVESPFDDKWSILIVPGESCGGACDQAMYVTRQVWIRLNKDAHRVQRVLLNGVARGVASDPAAHPDIKVFVIDAAEFARFPALEPNGQVYLVDPFGFLMMRYPLSLNPKDIYSDLQRLLKYSDVKRGE